MSDNDARSVRAEARRRVREKSTLPDEEDRAWVRASLVRHVYGDIENPSKELRAMNRRLTEEEDDDMDRGYAQAAHAFAVCIVLAFVAFVGYLAVSFLIWLVG